MMFDEQFIEALSQGILVEHRIGGWEDRYLVFGLTEEEIEDLKAYAGSRLDFTDALTAATEAKGGCWRNVSEGYIDVSFDGNHCQDSADDEG